MNLKPENVSKLLRTCLTMFVFGNLYNIFYWWVYHRKKMAFELTVFWVVGGVFVNVVGLGYVVSWRAFRVMFLLLAASGLPMTCGAMWQLVVRWRKEHNLCQRADEL